MIDPKLIGPDPDQGDLFAPWPAWSPDSPAGKFEQFHHANPEVFETLVKEARRWMAEGRGKLGISLLLGRVRWVLSLKLQRDGDGFRVNDHCGPFYSRLLMHSYPEFEGLFDIRRSYDADQWLADLARTGRQAA